MCYSDEEESSAEVKVHFRVIETLVSKLPNGQQVVDEVRGRLLLLSVFSVRSVTLSVCT